MQVDAVTDAGNAPPGYGESPAAIGECLIRIAVTGIVEKPARRSRASANVIDRRREMRLYPHLLEVGVDVDDVLVSVTGAHGRACE